MARLSSLLFLLPALAYANNDHDHNDSTGIRPHQIKNLVTFGDSYTDTFWMANGGSAQWPTYAAGYAHIDLFPYARSGATCSNNLTYRPFPSLFESQLPLYFEEKSNGTLRKLRPDETIYSLWIGTNDFGVNSIISGSNMASIVDVTTCMANWVKTLYQNGGRNFLFQNMIPLETTPLYSPDSYPNQYWTEPRNTTEWSLMMTQLVYSVNSITKLMLQDLASNLRGAHIGVFDSHSLFTDMYNHPKQYLNGTVPLNITGCASSCIYSEDDPASTPACTVVNGTDRDSYLWFDELHPSEQASRMVAREVADVIQGKKNKWTTWLS